MGVYEDVLPENSENGEKMKNTESIKHGSIENVEMYDATSTGHCKVVQRISWRMSIKDCEPASRGRIVKIEVKLRSGLAEWRVTSTGSTR